MYRWRTLKKKTNNFVIEHKNKSRAKCYLIKNNSVLNCAWPALLPSCDLPSSLYPVLLVCGPLASSQQLSLLKC